MTDLLVQQEKYLEAGIHIGTKIKTPDMNQFIYKARQDKLFVLDLKKVDDRLRFAAKLISRYDSSTILVVASRAYAANAASKFASLVGCKVIAGRFVPGIFTNPARPNFCEPKLLFVCDPKGERQGILEASHVGVPVIALCDTDNSTKFVDWIIPCNNKGKKSLALIFYLLTREVMKVRGLIASNEEFKIPLEEFEEMPPELGEEGEGTGAEGEGEEPVPSAPEPAPKTVSESIAREKSEKEGGESNEGAPGGPEPPSPA